MHTAGLEDASPSASRRAGAATRQDFAQSARQERLPMSKEAAGQGTRAAPQPAGFCCDHTTAQGWSCVLCVSARLLGSFDPFCNQVAACKAAIQGGVDAGSTHAREVKAVQFLIIKSEAQLPPSRLHDGRCHEQGCAGHLTAEP